jgi:hypothetical protein
MPAAVHKIDLGHGLAAQVDAADAELVADLKWHAVSIRGRLYARAWHRGLKRHVFLHRLVALGELLILFGDPGDEIDHASNDGLDCRRGNLRVGSHRTNMLNVRSRAGSSSRFRGVRKGTGRNAHRWRAAIKIDGRERFLGYFASEQAAAERYDLEARTLFGVCGRFNFPRDGELPAVR